MITLQAALQAERAANEKVARQFQEEEVNEGGAKRRTRAQSRSSAPTLPSGDSEANGMTAGEKAGGEVGVGRNPHPARVHCLLVWRFTHCRVR